MFMTGGFHCIYDRKEDQTDNRFTNAYWAPGGMMQIVLGTQKVVYWDLFKK